MSIESYFAGITTTLIAKYGALGVLVGMFFESSIFPVPSELVLVSAGALGIDVWTIVIFGTIGSTLGSMVGYWIGSKGGRPIIDRFGKYLFLTQDKVDFAEEKTKKYGGKAVFVARLIPFIPYKVFSIAAGILRLDFKQFVLFTFLGTIPRAFILATLGQQIAQYQNAALIFIVVAIAILAIAWYVNSHLGKKSSKNAEKNSRKKITRKK